VYRRVRENVITNASKRTMTGTRPAATISLLYSGTNPSRLTDSLSREGARRYPQPTDAWAVRSLLGAFVPPSAYTRPRRGEGRGEPRERASAAFA
jgi:hypothetical protein